jgi:hypothetical protein
MFDLFKQESRPKDVKAIRNNILQFIKEQLQKAEGGEGGNIKGLSLYVTCAPGEKHLYEAALYADDEQRFKEEEVQRIADDYAIALPDTWTMEIVFVETAPPEAIQATDVDAALFISTKKKLKVQKNATAYLKVLNGEAEKVVYTIQSSQRKVNIGREKRAQTADGFMRENDIAFPDKSKNESNRSISRQHAHIEWDNDNNSFVLFPDEGGLPPMNKIKVREADGNIFKLQAMEIGHHLKEGDQIVLGESALLEFTYREPEN